MKHAALFLAGLACGVVLSLLLLRSWTNEQALREVRADIQERKQMRALAAESLKAAMLAAGDAIQSLGESGDNAIDSFFDSFCQICQMPRR